MVYFHSKIPSNASIILYYSIPFVLVSAAINRDTKSTEPNRRRLEKRDRNRDGYIKGIGKDYWGTLDSEGWAEDSITDLGI